MSSSSNPIQIIQRGHEEYEATYDAMRAYTDGRNESTPDQIWLVEHSPVFTLGLGADRFHILSAHHIPVIETDRGGEVTYHGPGQVVAYLLLDLKRRRADNRLYVREFVYAIEEAVLDTLSAYNLKGIRSPGAPGVYIGDGRWQGTKIAALGVKVRSNGCAYHGVSLNVDMDLTPFTWINPCGYAGLGIVDMKTVGVTRTLAEVQEKLAQNLVKRLSA